MRFGIDSIRRAKCDMDIKTFIGQKFIIGFEGRDTKTLQRLYEKCPFGGVILFERNYESKEQIKELIIKIQGFNRDVPLFISVDQEGGNVQRFKKDFTRIETPAALGKLYESEGKKAVEKIF